LLDFLIENSARAEIIAQQSAAIQVSALGTKFCDSYFLLRAPLSEIGAKGSVDFEESSDAELEAYNRQDNKILFEALHSFCDVVESLGGTMATTVASTAMDIFRRSYQRETAYSTDESIALSRKAYYASDVQVRSSRAAHCYIYDINSSFPASMALGECPWQFAGRVRRKIGDSRKGIAYCSVHAPNIEHPFLPVRAANGGVYFPVGSWAGWYTEADIQYASELGYRITPHSWLLYRTSDSLAGYATDIYKKRQASSDFWQLALKFLLNSLYGKFAEDPDKEMIVLSRPRPNADADPYYPGAWKVPASRLLPHEHPHVCAWITSLSRIALHRMVMRISSLGYQVFYNDTDSVFTDAPWIPNIGDGLGQWGRAGIMTDARFEAAKLYSGIVEYGDKHRRTIKAKGFAPVSSAERRAKRALAAGADLDSVIAEIDALWGAIESGKNVRYEASRRFRRILAGARPGEDSQFKSKKGSRLPKRAPLDNGRTRPWTYDEISERAI
jgi:hypothetical protein